MDLDRLEALIGLCNKHNVNHIKTSEVEIGFYYDMNELHDKPTIMQENDNKQIEPVTLKEEIVSDEEMLLWSTGFYNEEKTSINEELAK